MIKITYFDKKDGFYISLFAKYYLYVKIHYICKN